MKSRHLRSNRDTSGGNREGFALYPRLHSLLRTRRQFLPRLISSFPKLPLYHLSDQTGSGAPYAPSNGIWNVPNHLEGPAANFLSRLLPRMVQPPKIQSNGGLYQQ